MDDAAYPAREQTEAPSPGEVRAALDGIVASPDFTASDRARRFLRYVVEETLAGRAERIKAFSVAVEVFGRDESFDPQNDPVVRIEAGRLRRALEHYYLLSGKDDAVFIDIPKGGYVPTFTRRDPAEPEPAAESGAEERAAAEPTPAATVRWPRYAPAAVLLVALIAVAAAWLTLGRTAVDGAVSAPPGEPRVLVLPFTDLGEGQVSALYSAALTDEIVTALGHFKEITVLGVQTSRALPTAPDTRTLNEELRVGYLVEGSVRSLNDRIRVTARLTSSPNGAVLWSKTYENPVLPEDLFELPAKTAGEIAAAIAQPYGIVFQAETTRAPQAPPRNLEAYLCTLRYYTYRADITPENYGEARTCLEKAVAEFPEYATAWALLAHIYIDEIRTGFAQGADAPPAERALAAARTAVRLDSDNVRALQALATALFFSHNLDEAFKVSDRALALNPNDSELLGQLGQLVGMAGRPDEGRALLERALALNPAHTGFYRGVLSVLAFMQGDFDTAVREVEQADLQRLPIYHGVAAIAYAEKGMIEKGKAELAMFEEMAPDFIPNLWAELDRRNFPPESQLLIGGALEKLGVILPPRPAAIPPQTANSG